MPYANPLDQQFIRDRVRVDDNGCWIWTLSLDRYGYPFLGPGAQERRAHRLAYRVFTGEIPAHLEVDHICHVTNCVNPDHLQLLTHADNLARRRPGVTKVVPEYVRRPKVRLHCVNGHKWAPENLMTKGNRQACRVCSNESGRRRRRARAA